MIYLICRYFFFRMKFYPIEKLIGEVLFFLVILLKVLPKKNDQYKI